MKISHLLLALVGCAALSNPNTPDNKASKTQTGYFHIIDKPMFAISVTFSMLVVGVLCYNFLPNPDMSGSLAQIAFKAISSILLTGITYPLAFYAKHNHWPAVNKIQIKS